MQSQQPNTTFTKANNIFYLANFTLSFQLQHASTISHPIIWYNLVLFSCVVFLPHHGEGLYTAEHWHAMFCPLVEIIKVPTLHFSLHLSRCYHCPSWGSSSFGAYSRRGPLLCMSLDLLEDPTKYLILNHEAKLCKRTTEHFIQQFM